MKGIKITGEGLKRVEEIEIRLDEVEPTLERSDVHASQYGTCPSCDKHAHNLAYWGFDKDSEMIYLGFTCSCGAEWEECYKLTPLPMTVKNKKI